MKTMGYSSIQWPDDLDVGKCCHITLALATGRTTQELVDLAKSIGLAGDRMSLPCVRVACRKLGLPIKSWEIYKGFIYEGNELPPTCLVFTSVYDGKIEDGVPVESPHILLRAGNMYFDPRYSGKSTHGFPSRQRITRYAEIDAEGCEWVVNTESIEDICGY